MIVSSIIYSISTGKIAREFDPCGPAHYKYPANQVAKLRREAMERAEYSRARNMAIEAALYALVMCTLWGTIG